MQECDVLIIGAGVVGLAVASEVTMARNNVLVVERNSSFGQETSSRNSEVIHAGMYYPKGSLKAILCVEGRNLLYNICEKNNIAYRKIGKVIVATEKEEFESLEGILSQGKENGLDSLQIVSRQRLKEIEPYVEGLAAIYSPQTGIIDSHRLMQYFLFQVENNNGIVAYNSEVIGIEKINSGYKVSVKNNNETVILKAAVVVNAAGLDSDYVAQLIGMDTQRLSYKLYYCKGQYFRVNFAKSQFINGLVYPVPKPRSGGLGIHATVDLAGGIRLGPDDNYLPGREKDYSVDNLRKASFYASAKRFLPFLKEDDLASDSAGIRPKLQGPDDGFRDFIIQDETDNNLQGFINLIGIESPGLTASPAIARYVKRIVENYINN